MNDLDPLTRVIYHKSETGVWSEVRTHNISFEIWEDRTTLLVFSGSRYHVTSQSTSVSTNIVEGVTVSNLAIGEPQPQDLEDVPVAKESTSENPD